MKKTIILIWVMIFFGCASEHSRIYRHMPTGIDEGDKIAVLVDSVPYSQSSPSEKKICKCLAKGFRKLKKDFDVISPEEFRNAALLNIELPENSTTQTVIDHILADKTKAELIEHMGVRYIILADEPLTNKHEKDSDSGWTLVGGHGAAMVTYYWEKSTTVMMELDGKVFDFKRRCKSGEISSWSHGESYYYVLFPLGFGWPSGVSFSQACEEFGNSVAKFLVGQKQSEKL